jgi:hypothetical protein
MVGSILVVTPRTTSGPPNVFQTGPKVLEEIPRPGDSVSAGDGRVYRHGPDGPAGKVGAMTNKERKVVERLVWAVNRLMTGQPTESQWQKVGAAADAVEDLLREVGQA